MNAPDQAPKAERIPMSDADWREPLLSAALRIGTTFQTVWFGLHLLTTGGPRWRATSLVIAASILVGAIAGWVPRISYGARLGALQQLFIVPIALMFLYYQPNANSGLYLALFVLVTALYRGTRAGVVAIAAVFLLHAAAGLLWQLKWLPLHAAPSASSAPMALAWIKTGVVQIIGTGAILAIALYVVRHGMTAVGRLARNEELLRTVIEASNDGIWDWDVRSGIITWSDRTYELLGAKPGALGVTFDYVSSLVHPDDREQFDRAIRDQVEANIGLEVELRLRRGDGSYGHFHGTGKSFCDAHGKPVRFVGSLRDVTERHRTAAAREQLLGRLRLTLKAGHLGTFRRNLSTGAGTWDEQMFSVMGRPVEDGPPDLDSFIAMVHPEDRSRVLAALRSALHRTSEVSYAFRLIRSDGTIRHVVSYAVAERDDPSPQWIIGVVNDITAVIEVQESLKKSAQRLQLVLSTANMGVWSCDLRTRQIEWDARMFELYGVDPEARVPTHEEFLALILPEDRSNVESAWATMLTGGAPYRVRYRIQQPHGSVRHMEAHAVVQFDALERASAVVGVVSDLTEIVSATAEYARLREQLQQTQKMEALGTMAAGVAHDFNNLLTGINGFVGLAASSLPPGHEAADLLKQALRGAVNARDLVRRILNFSRGRGDQARSLVRLDEAIRDTAPLISAALPSNVSLSIESDPDVPPIIADPGHLQQILLNLCINGSHAIGTQRGTLTIGLNRVTLSDPATDGARPLPAGCKPGPYACITVRDTGAGMDGTTLSRIFEPFFTTKKDAGTGLGLSIVRDIVTAHHGGIEVESTPNVGTTFSIYLPLAPQMPAGETPSLGAVDVPVTTDSSRILIVSTERSVAMILRLALQNRGFRPEVYVSSHDGWKRLAETAAGFDLLMVDEALPDITAQQFVTQARRLRPTVGVIVMSGQSHEMGDGDAITGDGVFTLRKPFEVSDLLTVVQVALAATRDEPALP